MRTDGGDMAEVGARLRVGFGFEIGSGIRIRIRFGIGMEMEKRQRQPRRQRYDNFRTKAGGKLGWPPTFSCRPISMPPT